MDHERLPIEEERYLQAVTLCLDALGDHDFAKQIDESPPEIQPIAFKIYRAWSNEPKALLPRSTLTRSFHALINLSENLRAFSPPQMNSKSLRTIGQSLEVAKVTTFEIDKDSPCYILRSDSLTQSGEWILRNAVRQNDFSEHSGRHSTANRLLRFSPADISRLDSQSDVERVPLKNCSAACFAYEIPAVQK